MKTISFAFPEVSPTNLIDHPVDEWDRPANRITVEQFEEVLDLIAQNGRTVMMARGILANESHSSCFLTFESSRRVVLNEIAPRLESRAWRGHFYVETSRIGQPGFLSAEDLRLLADRGHVFGIRFDLRKKQFQSKDRSELRASLRHPCQHLDELLGDSVMTGLLTGGRVSTELLSAARMAGLSLLFHDDKKNTFAPDDTLALLTRYRLGSTRFSADAIRFLADSEKSKPSDQKLFRRFWNAVTERAKIVAAAFHEPQPDSAS